MLRFDILTIFPELFDQFKKESLLNKAQEKRLLEISAHNIRTFATNKHNTVDDEPFGGGLGMVMQVEPIHKAVQQLTTSHQKEKTRIILFSPRGKKFTQKKAFELATYDQLILICGRYEGVDERVGKYIANEMLSLGSFDLMGGEVPAMAVIEAVSRLLPGVIGKEEFLQERVLSKTNSKAFVEYPQYTRPEHFEPEPGVRWSVPRVLTSGDHKKIAAWREKHKKVIL